MCSQENIPFLPADANLNEIRAFFAQDRFASEACGATIAEASRGYARCEMTLQAHHLNAMGQVMGGVLFTLADFALAVASNVGEPPTVSVSNTIEYLHGVQGKQLVAQCTTDKSGRSLGFYTVVIHDSAGVLVAKMTATCFRKA